MAADPTVALCAILKNEADYVEEWLAFHILQGVSRVVLYDNLSSDDTARRARSFARQVAIEVVSWPDSGAGFDVTQRLAYVDGTRRLRGAADFLACIDLDEFLYGSDDRSLGRALAGFPPEVAAIAVNQRIFGSSGHRVSAEGLVTSRFTMAALPDNPEAHWFKTVARPDRIAGFDSVHSVVLDSGAYVLSDGRPMPARPVHPGCAGIAVDGALRLNHYIVKSRQEYERKQQRWSGQDLRDKYSDAYFDDREAATNAVRDERLRALAPRIEALIDRARADAR